MREVSVESEEEGGEREVTGAVHGGRRKMRKRRLGFWVLEQCRVQRGTKPKQTKPDQATTNHSDFVDLSFITTKNAGPNTRSRSSIFRIGSNYLLTLLIFFSSHCGISAKYSLNMINLH